MKHKDFDDSELFSVYERLKNLPDDSIQKIISIAFADIVFGKKKGPKKGPPVVMDCTQSKSHRQKKKSKK